MKKIFTVTLIALWISTIFHSQQALAQDSTAFKPVGTVIAKGFLDYHIQDDGERGFNIGRAFLGYNLKFAPTWEAQLVLDGASYQTLNSDGTNSANAYVRNAFVTWKDYGFKLSFGLLGLLEYNLQENYWGFRYVEKSFQDLNGIGPSVDLGATFEYKISPILSADVTFTNGDGARKIQQSKSARYAAGVTLEPVKGLVFRAYGDVYNKSQRVMDQQLAGLQSSIIDPTRELERSNKYITAFFAGYKSSKFSAGAEYNHMYNYGLIKGLNYNGFSFYSAVRVAPKFQVYGRYDVARSATIENVKDTWYKKNVGDYAIVGLEFQPRKQIKISPNFRTSSRGNGGEFDKQFFVSLDFTL